MPQPLQGFTQHAPDRFFERAGVKPHRINYALRQFDILMRRARFERCNEDGELWLSRGWALVVRDGVIQTIFQAKRKDSDEMEGKKRDRTRRDSEDDGVSVVANEAWR